MATCRSTARGTNRHTRTHMDDVTHRINRSRLWLREKGLCQRPLQEMNVDRPRDNNIPNVSADVRREGEGVMLGLRPVQCQTSHLQ